MVMIILHLVRAYLLLIVIRALLSWFNPDPTAPLVRLLVWITEPVLSPIRRVVPPIAGRIDLSPFIALLISGWLLRTMLR